jgi:hypothetical protein
LPTKKVDLHDKGFLQQETENTTFHLE